MFPLIFCGLWAQKFWRVRTFSANSPRIEAVLCPKLGKAQKTEDLHPEMEWFLCSKLREDRKEKDLQPELERFLCPKSL